MRRTIGDIIVEWDANKEKLNILKHRITFKTAALVFADNNRIEFYDFKHSINENRYVVIGIVNKLIVVIYTERGNVSRIISARAATTAERNLYYGRNH